MGNVFDFSRYFFAIEATELERKMLVGEWPIELLDGGTMVGMEYEDRDLHVVGASIHELPIFFFYPWGNLIVWDEIDSWLRQQMGPRQNNMCGAIDFEEKALPLIQRQLGIQVWRRHHLTREFPVFSISRHSLIAGLEMEAMGFSDEKMEIRARELTDTMTRMFKNIKGEKSE